MTVVAAIDTGGTKIVGAAVNENGEILQEFRVPNTKRSGPFLIETYKEMVRMLQREYTISAIGIGAGGRINEKTGTVLYAVDIYKDYIGLNIKQCIESEFHVPVCVTNDCRAAVYGEQWMGIARDFRHILGIILGTGVGGGYYCQGEMVDGFRGGCGEVGHMILHPQGRKCLCGQKGCAEKYISGTALWEMYCELNPEHSISSGYEFFEQYRNGDLIAKKILSNFVDDLAVCAINCANLYDPEVILIGGGLSDTSEFWWDSLLAKYQEEGNEHTKKIPLLKVSKGNQAAILGAAKIALSQIC